METPLIHEIVTKIEKLPKSLQKQVLDFVDTLQSSAPKGVPGKQLLQFRNLIPQDDLELIKQAIDLECEQVATNEW